MKDVVYTFHIYTKCQYHNDLYHVTGVECFLKAGVFALEVAAVALVDAGLEGGLHQLVGRLQPCLRPAPRQGEAQATQQQQPVLTDCHFALAVSRG